MITYAKRGYLTDDFRIFHLVTRERREFDYHYHDFDKVLLFLKGNVTYCVEGMNYELKPYDIVLVRSGQVHRPVVRDDSVYERIVIYISRQFMEQYRSDTYDLSECFDRAMQEKTSVFRTESLEKSRLYRITKELEESFAQEEFAGELHRKVLFLELMIQLNRAVLHGDVQYLGNSQSGTRIREIITYLNTHLTEDISIDGVAEKMFMSRYHVMHLFKRETGDTIGNYVTNKRLIRARRLIEEGRTVMDACFESGFTSYSNFARAYKKNYGESATKMQILSTQKKENVVQYLSGRDSTGEMYE